MTLEEPAQERSACERAGPVLIMTNFIVKFGDDRSASGNWGNRDKDLVEWRQDVTGVVE